MKLKTRFIILFVSLIVTFTAIGIFTSISLGRISRYNEIEKQVNTLYSLSLELRKNESDFFNWDLKNPEYFKTGESKNSKNFVANFDQINTILTELKASEFAKHNHIVEDLTRVEQSVAEYNRLFSIIKKNKLELGFDNIGLIGEMNIAAQKIEAIIQNQNNSSLKIQLLSLRSYEKEYLFNRSFTSKSDFDKQLFRMYKAIPKQIKNSALRKRIISTLKDYGDVFNNFVDKDMYTGYWRDEGLMASLEIKGTDNNSAIEELSHNISDKTEHYISHTKLLLLIFISIFALGELLLGFFIFISIYQLMGGEPEVVANISKSIAKGDLRIKKAEKSKYKGIMKHVLTMTDNLKRIISGIHLNSQQIAIAGKNFLQTSITISNVANQQASHIEDIAQRSIKISESIGENAKNAKATEGISLLAKNDMQKIQNQTESSLVSSKTIREKVAIINHITTQTKILALNAAVEAARAGKYGRGFQVIADEVKRLAEISQEAAKEINTLTESNLKQAELSTELVHKILPLIEKTSTLIETIADSSQEQDVELNHINQSIERLNSISQENAVASEEMASGSEELEEQITLLTEMIEYFKFEKTEVQGIDFTTQKETEKKKKKKKKRKLRIV